MNGYRITSDVRYDALRKYLGARRKLEAGCQSAAGNGMYIGIVTLRQF
jgi:tetrahydromethanopterin S-methyltransferase subunit F